MFEDQHGAKAYSNRWSEFNEGGPFFSADGCSFFSAGG